MLFEIGIDRNGLFAALALATGVCFGIALGIELCIRYGRSREAR